VPNPSIPSVHQSAFDTSYLTPAETGDHTKDVDNEAFTDTTSSYLMVTAVDVFNPKLRGSIVVTGGSVTDGSGSRTTGPMGKGPAASPNSRWSDVLARRIVEELPRQQQLAVANAGIGGNTASEECGAIGGIQFGGEFSSVEERYDRDVLSLSGVSHVFIYAGTNDLGIGAGCSAQQIIAGFTRLVKRAHAEGIEVVVATVTPRLSYTPIQNQHRHEVNSWILSGGNCSGICNGNANFDAVISWFANPNAIDPNYDSGDTIHPNAEGYARMGNVIDLDLFRQL
jgi:lysophospholipase L1-like esterase